MKRALLLFLLASASVAFAQSYPGETKLDRELREDRERRDQAADERKERNQIRAADARAARAEAIADEALALAQQPRIVYVQPPAAPAPEAAPPGRESVMSPEAMALVHARATARNENVPDFSLTLLADGNYLVAIRGYPERVLTPEATIRLLTNVTNTVTARTQAPAP